MAARKEDIFVRTIFEEKGLDKLVKQEKTIERLNGVLSKLSMKFTGFNKVGKKFDNIQKNIVTVTKDLEGNTKRVNKTIDMSNQIAKQKEIIFRKLDKQIEATDRIQRQAQIGAMKVFKKNAELQERDRKIKEKVAESSEILAKKNKFLSDWSEKLGVNTARVRQSMAYAGLTFDKTGNIVDFAGEEVENLDKIMKEAEVRTRKFNMSLLSVMFAGMALKRSMGGLLKPASEATGVFDILNDLLVDTFEPIMEAIIPSLEWLSDKFSGLGDTAKIIIGIIIGFLFVGGAMLALGGQLGLAYGGLSVQIASLTAALSSATVAFTGMGTAAVVSGTTAQIAFAPFLPIMYALVAVIGLVILIYYKWEDITNSLASSTEWLSKTIRLFVTSTVLFFSWLGDKIGEFSEKFTKNLTIIGIIISNWDKIKNYLSDTWDSIKQFFIDKWNSMIGWFKTKWQGLKDWFWNILVGIGGFFKNVWIGITTWFSDKLSSIKQFFKEKWNSLSIWFWDTLNKIGTFFKDKWNSIKTWFSDKLTGIYNFFKDIWDSLSNWFWDKLTSIKDFFSNIWNSIKETTRSVWGGIKDVIKGAINGIIGLINKLIGAWNSISFEVPRIRVMGHTFGGWTVGVPQVPTIPELAKGGIVRKPTLAMIGERGPEAVVPLNKKNTSPVINFSPTYNITVSDKYEFEKMIKFNNTKIVEDLRRMINT